MGHNFEQLGSASLDVWGGFSTYINPQDMPEGSSPRNWDVDFQIGSVITRAGLASVYSYAGQFVGPNVAQTATDMAGGTPWSNPTGILGSVSYASTTVGASSITEAAGSGTSTGSGSTPAWTNPANVWGGSAASVVLNQSSFQTSSAPLIATPSGFAISSDATVVGIAVTVDALANYSQSGGSGTAGPNACTSGTTTSPNWTNPSNITGASYATFANGNYSTTVDTGNLVAKGFSFSIPGGATITSITVSFKKYTSVAQGAGSENIDLNVQLLKGGVATGSNLAKIGAWPSTPTVFTYGGTLWGAAWSPSDVNSSNFGVEITAEVTAGVIIIGGVPHGQCEASVGSVTATVSYTTSSGVGNATSTVQLSLNGSPVGSVATYGLTSASTPFTTGNSTYLWGTSFTPDDINNALGVLVTAQAGSTFSAGSNYSFQANNLSVTVYYTGGQSDALQATTYSFSVAPTSGVSGITTTFNAYSSAATTLTIQLLKAGVPVGSPKIQALTTTPTVYTLGNATDLWSTSWLYSDINSNEFGYQFTASGTGVTNVQDAQITVYITPGLTNFNYIKSYIQNGSPTPTTTNNQTYTLALDADGLMWQENVSSLPNELSLVLSGIIPGSFANSATMDDREHILFSDLSIGTDRPRVYNGVKFDPLSQTGPGAPPVFKSSEGTGSGVLTITAYTYPSTYVITFTIDTATAPVIGSLYTINGVVSYLNGNTYSVLGSPMPDANHFSININHADDGGASGLTGTATPAYSYTITSITQTAAGPNPIPFNGQELIWSAAGAPQTPGDVLTFYYGSQDSGENQGASRCTELWLSSVCLHHRCTYRQWNLAGHGTQCQSPSTRIWWSERRAILHDPIHVHWKCKVRRTIRFRTKRTRQHRNVADHDGYGHDDHCHHWTEHRGQPNHLRCNPCYWLEQ